MTWEEWQYITPYPIDVLRPFCCLGYLTQDILLVKHRFLKCNNLERMAKIPLKQKGGSLPLLLFYGCMMFAIFFDFAVRLGQLQCKPPRAKAARTLSQPEPAVTSVQLLMALALSQSMQIGRVCQETTAGVDVTSNRNKPDKARWKRVDSLHSVQHVSDVLKLFEKHP